MIAFAATCDAIAATAGRLEKIALVAEYLRGLEDADLEPAARFFTGNPFAARDDRTLSLGRPHASLAAARARLGHRRRRRCARPTARTGDLGAALGPFVRPPADLGLFRETLSPGRPAPHSSTRSPPPPASSAQRRRQVLCERILGACTDPLEATYVIKIVTGDLRIGLREGLIADAIAAAFAREPAAVRRAASAAGDVGAVAVAAQHDDARRGSPSLSRADRARCSPPRSPTPTRTARSPPGRGSSRTSTTGSARRRTSRRSACRSSRARSTIVRARIPEIVAALRALRGSLILDGEIVAERDGRVLPVSLFCKRACSARTSPPELQAEIPVRYVVFDLLRPQRALLARRAAGASAAGRAGGAALAGVGTAVDIAPLAAARDTALRRALRARFARPASAATKGLIFKRDRLALRAGPARQMVAQAQARALDARLRRRRRRMGPRPARAGALGLHLRGARCRTGSSRSAKPIADSPTPRSPR